MFVLLAMITVAAHAQHTVNVTIQNCISTQNSFTIDIYLTNVTSTDPNERLNAFQAGIDMNNYASYINGGTLSIAYVNATSDLNSNQNNFNSTNTFIDPVTHEIRITGQVVTNAANGTAMPYNTTLHVGTFVVTNTVNWTSANNTAGLAFYTGSVVSGKTVLKVNTYPTGTGTATASAVVVSPPPCDPTLNGCSQVTWYQDADGDGYGNAGSTSLACSQPAGYVANSTDCNDANPSVNPGATEVCNLIDDNCNGQIDEGVQSTFYADADGDTYGDANSTTLACSAPAGYVSNNTDCDDTHSSVHPGASEVCNGVDDNCNGQIDEGVQSTFYADADGDGYGDASSTTMACSAPAGYVSNSTDCDDTHSSVHPGATEQCNGIDDNCDGLIDNGIAYTTYYTDADGDGYGTGTGVSLCSDPGAGYSTQSGDCNDANAAVNPGATEVCNGIDDNCDGQIDEGVKSTFYADADGDNYGDASSTTLACTAPAGYVSNNTDCNDGDASIHPGASEVCNGLDDNCNGQIDEGVQSTFYRDADGDTYGNPNLTTLACSAPTGYVSNNTDCDDGDAAVHPGATEVCNGIDDNCNGQIDEGVQSTFYADADGDGYGNVNATTLACSAPTGYVSDHTDCDDAHSSVHPGAVEVCNGIDDNCDGQIDEGVKSTFYADADGDGYGNVNSTTLACSAPAGYVSDHTDCDDTHASVHPGATEICNGVDDNCDGLIDNGISYTTYYTDADGDGYGTGTGVSLCSNPGAGYSTQNGDCNDGNADVHPGATEVCNGLDDNCDGQIDEGVKSTFYADADGDGYGNVNSTTLACSAPAGYVSDHTDCDDTHSSVHPGAAEQCNGIDDNCDGLIDNGIAYTTYYTDADGDGYGTGTGVSLCSNPGAGYSTQNGDCNDANSAVHPGVAEVCNGIDDNCNGQIDEGVQSTFYRDADGDTYGNASVTTLACSAPSGYVSDHTDCDDNDATVHSPQPYYADNDQDGYGAGTVIMLCSSTAPSGYSINNTDCNDANTSVHPGASEVCNGLDDNCDGQIDEGVQSTFYRDADGDSYGNASLTTLACSAPAGYVSNNTDCNDNNSSIHPGASEVCNGLDDNCNGQIDEGVQSTFYRDADGDTYGNPSVTTLACSAPSGYVSNNTDCNDNDPTVHTPQPYYADNDNDGYGAGSIVSACSSTPPAGYSVNNTDCNDANASVHPGASEVCNGLDDNCNGQIDEGVQSTFYRDQDGDGYGNASVTTLSCSAPAGYVSNNTDCNDNNSSVHPGASEVCNGIDDNCNGQIDEGVQSTFYADADGDGYGNPIATTLACSAPSGYVSNNTDCNDASSTVHPGAPEICSNGIDDNCNGQIDEGCGTFTYYADADGDSYGNPNNSITSSSPTPPPGYVTNNTDCNDGNAAVHPGAVEVCNGIDDNCNGQIDETTLTASASSNSPVCANSTLMLSSSGNGATSYSWVGPNGFTSTLQNPKIVHVTTAATGTYTVTTHNSVGCTMTATTVVTVNPSTAITQQPTSQTVCAGSTATFTVGAVGGSLTYKWQKKSGNTWSNISGATNSAYSISNVTTSLSGSQYRVVVTGSCGASKTSSAAKLTVKSPPHATASSNSPVCSGSTLNLSSSGGTSYSWSGPNGFTSSSQNPSITGVTGAAGGTYTVTVYNSTGCSSIATTPVTINTNCGTCTGFKTWTQYEFGDCSSVAGVYLTNNFALCFPSNLVLGCTKNLTLTSASAVCNFLPTEGPEKKLVTNVINPSDQFHNSLAAEVTGLALNIAFDNYDPNYMSSTTHLQDLYIVSGPFTGWTVLQLYNQAVQILGGCSTAYAGGVIEDAVEQVSWNYQDGTVDLGYLSCTPVRMINPAEAEGAGLKLYPNPNNGQFILDLNLGTSISTTVDVQIMNMLGQTVYMDRTGVMDGKLQEQVSLDKSVPAGTYLVRVTSGDQVFTKQIVYQK